MSKNKAKQYTIFDTLNELKSITDHNGTTYLYDELGYVKSYRDKHGNIYNVKKEKVGNLHTLSYSE